MSLEGANDMEKLKSLSAKTYKEQAIFFLNATWETIGGQEKDNVWEYVQDMSELDEKSGKEGCELEEMIAHRFLERRGETLTVREMREVLREIDLDTNKNVSLSEYIIFRHKLDYHAFVNNSMADPEELREAQRLLDDSMAKMKEAVAVADAARAAEAANKAALAELEAQQNAYDERTEDLKAKSETGGLVSRNKAKNELAQHLEADPTPLARAKINQGATVRKAEKARKAVEPAEKAAIDAFNEADAFLKEVASRTGSSQGGVWWLQRELYESKKFLPQSRGGIHK